MEAYSGFAEVYDLFMDNVPYGEWCRYLTGLLRDLEWRKAWCWISAAAPGP